MDSERLKELSLFAQLGEAERADVAACARELAVPPARRACASGCSNVVLRPPWTAGGMEPAGLEPAASWMQTTRSSS